jgi:branched-chain amino acid transport system ATP-binding protein/neutral amino acid transport system ATP-binding protein
MSLLTVSGVVCGYTAADEILKGMNFFVEGAGIVCVIGPNGAGKSTLLKAIAGLLQPSRGSIVWKDQSLVGRRPSEVARLGIAYVPQEHNVFPNMSVAENLEIGGYVERAHVAARSTRVMQRFPVLGEKRRHAARTLSGGERQILAMAMALMVEPTMLLLDEPSAGLAPRAAETLFATISAIGRDGMGVVLVEQNADQALSIADHACLMVDGRNSRTGTAQEFAADPDIRKLFLGG